MATTLELLDRLEEILKQSLPEDKAKETVEKEIPKIEEDLSKRLATKEDLYKVKEEIYQAKEELKGEIYLIKQNFNRIEKELLTVKILLWVVVILTGANFFPQLLNILKLLK